MHTQPPRPDLPATRTVTVAHTLPARAGSVTGALRFRPGPVAWKGVARPVTCSVSVVVGAVVSVDIGANPVSLGWLSRVRVQMGGLPPTYVFMNTLYSALYAVAAVILH